MEIIAKFEGQEASQNVLPAFEGSQSLEGLSRTLTLITHFVAPGQVRKRFPFNESPRIFLVPPRAGSFEALFHLLTEPNTLAVTTVLGTLSVGVAGSFIADAIKLVVRRAIGQDHNPATSQLRQTLAQHPGPIEALIEAIEPSLKRAHTVVNSGAGHVTIINGDNNIVRLDARSKSYLSTSTLDPTRQRKEVSVGMLNANTRNGRVWDQELRRTVPIHVPTGADPQTLSNLAISLERYSARLFRPTNSDVFIVFNAELAEDNTVKRYLVYSADFEDSDVFE